ncbi:MAG: hypothetical protein WDZ51_07060 [Pirellulaceae bacterium]
MPRIHQLLVVFRCNPFDPTQFLSRKTPTSFETDWIEPNLRFGGVALSSRSTTPCATGILPVPGLSIVNKRHPAFRYLPDYHYGKT